MHLFQRSSKGGDWRRLLLCGSVLLTLILPQAAQSQSKRPAAGQSKPSTTTSKSTGHAPNPSAGTISGVVTDQEGSVAVGATVELTSDNDSTKQQAVSGDNGEYSFTNVPPGPFHLSVTAPGFDTKLYSGTAEAGKSVLVPAIALSIAAVTAEVSVELTPVEVAQEQVKEQEQQRVFGIIPNFYVSYVSDAAPLIPRQKFQLAWRSSIDPFTIVGAAALAGLQQAGDDYSGYGQGAAGYGKRFGAAYADIFSATFLGSAIFPSLLKQDPRYFYRGTGGVRSRLLYAAANSVMCKGDNKKWQPNYSNVLGSFAAGGLSYLYYPESDRDVSTIVQNSVVRIAESSLAGIFQEFVLRRFTTTRDKKRTSLSNSSSTNP